MHKRLSLRNKSISLQFRDEYVAGQSWWREVTD
jgi:hypothetical protein